MKTKLEGFLPPLLMLNIKVILALTLVPVVILAILYFDRNSLATTSSGHEAGKEVRTFKYLMKEAESFRYPGSMIGPWQEYNGNLYVHDQVDQKTYVLDPEGHFLDTLGRKGNAPWQNQQVKQFHVTHAGVYYLDNGLMTAKQLDHAGVPVIYKKHGEVFWDGLHLFDQNFLILNDESLDFGFYKWNCTTGQTGSLVRFDSIVESDVKRNRHIAFEGEMVQGKDFHYYVCARAGRFLTFSRNGDFAGSFETLDKTEPPEIIEREYDNLTMFERRPDEIVNYAAASDGVNLYILSTVAFKETDRMSIDKYGPGGLYLGSMRVPNHRGNLPVNITAREQSIWVLYENLHIIRYDILAVSS